MILRAQTGRSFYAILTNAPTGLAGTVTVEIYDPVTSNVVSAESALQIDEIKPKTYRANRAITDAGSYLVRWEYGTEVFEQPLVVGLMSPDEIVGMVPTVDDIADRLHMRTVDRANNYLGTFTDKTTPSDTRVERLIVKSYDHVTGKTGLTIPDGSIGDVRNMIELYTAMQIELSHYADQVRAGRSPYPEFKELYDDGMAALIESLGGEGASVVDEQPTADGLSSAANYGFPETSIGDGMMP